MTVEELIKELEEYPKDAKVLELNYYQPVLHTRYDKDSNTVLIWY